MRNPRLPGMRTQHVGGSSRGKMRSAPAHWAPLPGCSRRVYSAQQPPAAQAQPQHSGPPADPPARSPAPSALLPCTQTSSALLLPAARLLPRPPQAPPQRPALRCCYLTRALAEQVTPAWAPAQRVRRQLGQPGPPAGPLCHPTGVPAAQPVARTPGQACAAAAPPRLIWLAQ